MIANLAHMTLRGTRRVRVATKADIAKKPDNHKGQEAKLEVSRIVRKITK